MILYFFIGFGVCLVIVGVLIATPGLTSKILGLNKHYCKKCGKEVTDDNLYTEDDFLEQLKTRNP